MSGLSLLDIANGNFDKLHEQFVWNIPDKLNVAELVVSRHTSSRGHEVDGDTNIALIAETDSGAHQRYSFDEIDSLSNKLANVFRQLGIKRGDRVAVVLPQRVETALVHIAAQKLGAVSLPLSVLFGDDALRFRLSDSESLLNLQNEPNRFESVRVQMQSAAVR